jgi:GTPase SAR1 family protein
MRLGIHVTSVVSWTIKSNNKLFVFHPTTIGEQNMSSQVDVKTVLLGAASVGKTTLVERYLNKRFLEGPQTVVAI